MKDKKTYTVYCHICPDGTRYFGCTCQIPEKRWGKNGNGYKYRKQYFCDAIQKFGWEDIKHEIISTGLSEEEGFSLEKELILRYNTTNRKYGWNIGEGGRGNQWVGKTEEELLEIGKNRSGENHPLFGKCHTEETKQKMRENHADFSGENHPMCGKRGNLNPRYGTKHSEETKRKMSESSANYIPRTQEMYEDVRSGIRRKDFISKYSVSRKIWDSIKKDIIEHSK